MASDVPDELTAHPWIRYWARLVDIAIAGLGFATMLYLADPRALNGNVVSQSLVALFIWVFVEAAMLTAWGATPGKALMRIRVTEDGARPPKFGKAFARSFRVWFFGLGLGIPLVSFVTMCVAFSRLTRRGRTTWDQKLDLRVTHREISGLRWAILVAILITLVLANAVSDTSGLHRNERPISVLQRQV